MGNTQDDLDRGHDRGMVEEEVDEVHNNLIPRQQEGRSNQGIPTKIGASNNLHQPNKTSKPSVGIVESLAPLKQSVGKKND